MNKIIILSLLFALSELLLMFLKRSNKATSRSRKDRGSLLLLWVVITLGFAGGFMLAKPLRAFWFGFGLSFIAGGLIIRWISIIQLEKSFTVDVAITQSAVLKTDGIYELARHPSYAGILLIVTGFASVMSSLYSAIIFILPVFLAINYRIKIEEELLINEFGKNYLDYMKQTKKIIPGIY